jgi:hypothetical protein
MTNQEKIRIEIEKQINAGFNVQEIRENLLLQNFSNAEINESLKGMPAAASPEKQPHKFGILSLLLSLFFVVKGIIYMSNGSEVRKMLGLVFLLLGLAGFIIKSVSIARK